MTPDSANSPTLIAAIDLGSNSFHMILAREDQGEIRVLERLGEKIRLAAGLDEHKRLSQEAMQRGLDCLQRFAPLIAGLPDDAVRVIGTNTLREARNRDEFIERAEQVLGHTLEVVHGREEARLIYLGVSHTLPATQGRRLVVDIGGGSTEFIVGQSFEPLRCESLQMGCVSFTSKFFADGKITNQNYDHAYTQARLELMAIEQSLRDLGWDEAVGSSGTIKAVGPAIAMAGQGNGEVNAEALKWLKKKLLKIGEASKIDLPGIKPDRRPTLAAGTAILEAVFDALEVRQMIYSDGAMREGVLYDMLGRRRHEDVRDRTLHALMERYHADPEQATRVEALAIKTLDEVAKDWGLTEPWCREMLGWAAKVHEIGQDIAHYQYQKHGAYLVEHSDLAGFSRQEQQGLALLVRGQRRNIPLEKFKELNPRHSQYLLRLCILLRFAILFNHTRRPQQLPDYRLKAGENSLQVQFPEGWLAANPLTKADFEAEADWLKRIDFDLLVS